jgi:hypothetical protein
METKSDVGMTTMMITMNLNSLFLLQTTKRPIEVNKLISTDKVNS